MKFLFFVLAFISFSCFALVSKPDLKLTPGSFCTKKDKDFLSVQYAEKISICKRAVSTERKIKVFKAYGVPASEYKLYTIDHKMSLFLGGSNDSDNLWPQPKSNSSAKLEDHVYLLLKGGKIDQKKAISLVLSVK